MTPAAVVLWVGLLVGAPEWPLGPYARPGIPLPVFTTEPTELDLNGWPLEVDGLGWLHPMDLPSEGPGPRAVPEGRRLVGVWGDLPAEVEAELAAGALVVRVDLGRIPPEAWRALDLFDRLYATRRTPAGDALLLAWAKAGGSVAIVGELAGAAGVAGVLAVPDATQLVRGGRDLAIPRPAAARPWLYELLGASKGGMGALGSARRVVGAFAAVLLTQLLLAVAGRISVRGLLAGVALVSAVACVIALLATRSDFRPLARGRIEIDFVLDGSSGVRRRTYEIFAAAVPGAEVVRENLWTPVPYRPFAEAWWRRRDGRELLAEGVTRLYLREEWIEAPEAVPEDRAPLALARGECGAGWELTGAILDPSPVADPGPVPLLGRFRATPVR